MKHSRLCLSVVVSLSVACLVPLRAYALDTDSPSLIITEIKIKNDTTVGGYNEFIEIYNADITSVNLNDFTIEYFNSPAPLEGVQPNKKAIIADGLLLPTQTIVLAANTAQISGSLDSPFSSLADAGGLVRIRDLDDVLQDQFAWTSTSALAISPIIFLSTTSSNKTKSFVRSNDDQANPVLTNPTWQLTTPSPHADGLLPVPQAEPEVDPEPAAPVTSDDPVVPVLDTANDQNDPTPDPIISTLLPLQITELLPNPAAPATDANDEFVELYNPNSETVDLDGYRLQTGNSYSYTHAFDNVSLGPREYKAFYITETGTILANGGGRARLLNSSGATVSEVPTYGDASEGMAWASIDGTWQWTTTPTPDQMNVLTSPVINPPKATKTKTIKAKTTKKTAVKTSKAKTTKTSKTKAKTTAPSGSSDSQAPEVATIHPVIIAGVGLLAVAYAAYEYRFDFSNRLYQLRRYRAARQQARAKA